MARAWPPQVLLCIALASHRMHQLCTSAYLSFQSESQQARRLHNCDGGGLARPLGSARPGPLLGEGHFLFSGQAHANAKRSDLRTLAGASSL
jgi:hypothetical protein